MKGYLHLFFDIFSVIGSKISRMTLAILFHHYSILQKSYEFSFLSIWGTCLLFEETIRLLRQIEIRQIREFIQYRFPI